MVLITKLQIGRKSGPKVRIVGILRHSYVQETTPRGAKYL